MTIKLHSTTFFILVIQKVFYDNNKYLICTVKGLTINFQIISVINMTDDGLGEQAENSRNNLINKFNDQHNPAYYY